MRRILEASERAAVELTERAVAVILPAVQARLRPLLGRLARHQPDPEVVRCRQLVEMLSALDANRRDVVGDQAHLLWSALLERFGGVSGYLSAPVSDRDRYLQQIDAFVARYEEMLSTDRAHEVLGTALFAIYAHHLVRSDISPEAKVVGKDVVALIEEARKRSKARGSIVARDQVA
ncbi:hypothetical protein [Salinarimonas ramus]|uniref:Uncharacterized protein n=1 Tax=Salinarimonas ramus TaxID=690164 RepID=A0A917Q8I8_9HYPH|nr:hypothetical protein [Salinarimonas ramus]GGK35590.1 hypothetical protein GCM10011322_23060 [Salinarimonas ramus]